MTLYFADRKMTILGMASTVLPRGLVITEDLKTEEIETGVTTFSCRIPFDDDTRKQLEEYTAAGNYIFRYDGDTNEFYTIVETEVDTEAGEVYLYAEDAGLDIINEVALQWPTDATANAERGAHSLAWYFGKLLTSGTYAAGDTGGGDTGFELGINEAEGDTAQALTWSDEGTVTERLLDIAEKFGCEIGFRFEIKGMAITHKYVDVYKTRGADLGVQLRLGTDVERIVTKTSIANLATALKVTGGDDAAGTPVNLEGYSYDDDDFYVASGSLLCSREAHDKWSRYINAEEPETIKSGRGDIVRTFTSDTVSQAQLCSEAIEELKKLREPEVNYEVELSHLPDGVKLGDRVTIVDDKGEQYLSARILKLETSETEDTRTVALGDYLIRNSGISEKVAALAAEVAATAQANRVNIISQNITSTGVTLLSSAPLEIPATRMVYDQVTDSFDAGYAWDATDGVTQNAMEETSIWGVLLKSTESAVLYPLFISQLYASKAVIDGDVNTSGQVSAESVVTPEVCTNAIKSCPQTASHIFSSTDASGTVFAAQKLGWCMVSAEVTLTSDIGSDWEEVLTGMPVPQHGQPVCTIVPAEGDGSADPLSVRITMNGSLQFMYGDQGEFYFQLTYPVL